VIEKFNFYDIYGYFLPGLVLLGVLWLPLGLVGSVWPPSSWSSAIAGAAFAYILGHLVQIFGTRDLPSKFRRDSKNRLRYPSDMALDANPEMPLVLVRKIASIFAEQFNLDLGVDQPPDDEIDKRRNVAFLIARQALIREKSANYAEQFQGMYALTRGLVIVFAVACAYWLGWAASTVRNGLLVRVALIVLTTALLVVINVSILLVQRPITREDGEEADWWTLLKSASPWTFLVGFLSVGYIAGLKYQVTNFVCDMLVLLSAVAFLASFRTYGAYKFFAGRFATTVWRDFLAYHVKITEAPTSGQRVDLSSGKP
jgi:hypothetical protein